MAGWGRRVGPRVGSAGGAVGVRARRVVSHSRSCSPSASRGASSTRCTSSGASATRGVLIPYEPNSEADLLTDEFRVRYRTNRFGYRDRLDRRAERTPGVARIGLLGDSFAAGWGVEFEETFGDRFERATGIEVVNAAKNGGCPLWFVPQARFVRERFAPDWLLVQIFDNDLDDNLDDHRRSRSPVGERVRRAAARDCRIDSLAPRIAPGVRLARAAAPLPPALAAPARKRLDGTPYVKPGAQPGQPDPHARGGDRGARRGSDARARLSGPFSFHDPAQAGAFAERIRWNALLLDQLLEESARRACPWRCCTSPPTTSSSTRRRRTRSRTACAKWPRAAARSGSISPRHSRRARARGALPRLRRPSERGRARGSGGAARAGARAAHRGDQEPAVKAEQRCDVAVSASRGRVTIAPRTACTQHRAGLTACTDRRTTGARRGIALLAGANRASPVGSRAARGPLPRAADRPGAPMSIAKPQRAAAPAQPLAAAGQNRVDYRAGHHVGSLRDGQRTALMS